MKRPHFRFEDLEIWQLGKELSVRFHKVADNLEQRKLYRYAEQIRAAGLSVPNNIAEGSGSLHSSMLLVFEAMELLASEHVDELLWKCDELSRKITNYIRSRQP